MTESESMRISREAQEFNSQFREYINDEYYSHPAPRNKYKWVMNSEWLREMRNIQDDRGYILWAPNASNTFYGLPYEIREDNGRWGVPRMVRE